MSQPQSSTSGGEDHYNEEIVWRCVQTSLQLKALNAIRLVGNHLSILRTEMATWYHTRLGSVELF